MFANLFRRAPAPPTAQELMELKELCSGVAAHIHAAGHDPSALSDEARDWPKDFRHRLALLKVYNEVLNEGAGGKGHRELLWSFFSKMRFTPTSDIFDRIQDEDVIEVYDTNDTQIYRNLNYFGVVSMSVEDMLNINWKREYKRNGKVLLSLVGLAVRFMTGQFKSTYDCTKIPVHRVQEMIAKRYLIELNLKYISPLKQNGKCVGLVVVSRARRLKPAQA